VCFASVNGYRNDKKRFGSDLDRESGVQGVEGSFLLIIVKFRLISTGVRDLLRRLDV
jgi:hypothetical protein